MRRTRVSKARSGRTRLLAGAAAVAMVLTACGGDDADDTGDDPAEDADVEAGEDTGEDAPAEEAVDADGVIRMVLAPDPVWDWLNDQGIRQEMEEEAQMTILDSSTWDEFGVYAGGHADVVSAGSYEVPELEEATGVPTTAFGRYNADKSVLAVRAGSDYETICDLEGETIVSLSAVSSTLIWGAYAAEECGLELTSEGGDFDLVITDIQNLAPLTVDGDAEACICMPDFGITQIASGELEMLYDGQTASQLFSTEYSDGHIGPMVNVFLGPTSWVENNQEEAAFLLSVWERGIEEWNANRDEIIASYPQHFAVEGDEEVEMMQDWFDNNFDWFVESVYIDEEWIEGENQVFDLMRDSGFLDADTENPNWLVIPPPE